MKPLLPLVVLSLAVSAGCHRAETVEEKSPARVAGDAVSFPADGPQAAAVPVVTAEPARAGHVRLAGRLVWDEDATVRVFSVFEGRVTRLVAPVGERVEKNAPLALIASADYGQVQADAGRAALDLKLAEQTLRRVRDLAANGAAPEKELHAAEIEFARAQSEAQRTARRLEMAGGGANATDHEFALRSPLPGVVVEKNINPGQAVRPDQLTSNAPPLFVVTDPTRLWVLLDATEQDLPQLKAGSTVVLHTPTYPGQNFEARVLSISDAIDPASRTIKVRAAVANPQRALKAEMFVTGDIATPAPAGVEVPAAVVYLKGDRHFVFVEKSRGTFERREVKIGAQLDGHVLVLEGLATGERVVGEGGPVLDQLLTENGSSG